MTAIQYVEGDATRPIGEGPKILVHVCDDTGSWGKGFVMAISKRWKEPEREYRRWRREAAELPFELGQVQFVQAEPGLWVANLIGQQGLGVRNGVPPVRYPAIRTGLSRVGQFAQEHGASIHLPRIGCGLAGGKWEEIEPLLESELVAAGVAVTVYDFKP